MVDSISLVPSQRSLLLERSRISQARAEATYRLATGKKVNSAKDDAQSYLRADALNSRAASLLSAKSDIGRGIDTLASAQVGLQSIEKLGQQLKGIALAAQSADSTQRTTLAQQFDTVRTQINNLAGDASFLGTNLINNTGSRLQVSLSDQPGQQLSVNGVAADSASLGVSQATTTFNNFASQSDIDSAISAVESALSTLQSNQASFATSNAILNVREDFTQNVANVLQQGADKLVEADLNAEAARSLSANVRDGLALQGLKLSNDGQRRLVDLISSNAA